MIPIMTFGNIVEVFAWGVVVGVVGTFAVLFFLATKD